MNLDQLKEQLKIESQRYRSESEHYLNETIQTFLYELSERCQSHIFEFTDGMGMKTIDIYKKKNKKFCGWIGSTSEEYKNGWGLMRFSIFKEIQDFLSSLELMLNEFESFYFYADLKQES